MLTKVSWICRILLLLQNLCLSMAITDLDTNKRFMDLPNISILQDLYTLMTMTDLDTNKRFMVLPNISIASRYVYSDSNDWPWYWQTLHGFVEYYCCFKICVPRWQWLTLMLANASWFCWILLLLQDLCTSMAMIDLDANKCFMVLSNIIVASRSVYLDGNDWPWCYQTLHGLSNIIVASRSVYLDDNDWPWC